MNDKLNQVWARVYADRKKFGIMCGLLLVGLLMWGRLLMKQVPRTATAKPETVATASATPSVQAPPPPPGRNLGLPAVRLNPEVRLNRDLFEVNPSAYKQVNRPKESVQPTKSTPSTTDRQMQMAAVRGQARGLTLQSVLGGAEPRAFINGRLLKIGEQISGFELIRIDQRRVVLEKNGIKIQLGM